MVVVSQLGGCWVGFCPFVVCQVRHCHQGSCDSAGFLQEIARGPRDAGAHQASNDAAVLKMRSQVMSQMEDEDLVEVARDMLATGAGFGSNPEDAGFMSAWSGGHIADVRALLPDGSSVPKEEAKDEDSQEDFGDEESWHIDGDPEGGDRKAKGKGKGKAKGGDAWFDRDTSVNAARRVWITGVCQIERELEANVAESRALLREVQPRAENVHFKHAYPRPSMMLPGLQRKSERPPLVWRASRQPPVGWALR